MNANKAARIFYMLGVSSYLCPDRIFKIRSLYGRWPCDILAVVDTTLSQQEKQLLQKIMDALSVSQFAILEIKDASHIDWICNQLLTTKVARKFLVFSEKWEPPSKNPLFLKTFLLNQLISDKDPEVKANKKKLWDNLQEWLKKDKI